MTPNLHIPHPDSRLTMKEAVERYKVNRMTITRLIKAGKFRAWKPDRAYQIDKESADRWFLETEVQQRRSHSSN